MRGGEVGDLTWETRAKVLVCIVYELVIDELMSGRK